MLGDETAFPENFFHFNLFFPEFDGFNRFSVDSK
jgi:hypothetical protein